MKRPRRPTVTFADSNERLPFAFFDLPVRSIRGRAVLGIEAAQAGLAQLAKVFENEPQVAVGKQGNKKGFGSSALEASGAGHKFDPGHGRLMKESLVLDVKSDAWLPYCREALQYVRGLL